MPRGKHCFSVAGFLFSFRNMTKGGGSRGSGQGPAAQWGAMGCLCLSVIPHFPCLYYSALSWSQGAASCCCCFAMSPGLPGPGHACLPPPPRNAVLAKLINGRGWGKERRFESGEKGKPAIGGSGSRVRQRDGTTRNVLSLSLYMLSAFCGNHCFFTFFSFFTFDGSRGFREIGIALN